MNSRIRKVEVCELSEQLPSGGVVSTSGILGRVVEAKTAILAILHDRGVPSSMLSMPPNTLESTCVVRPETLIPVVLGSCRKTHILTAAIQPVSIPVVNFKAGGGVHDKTMQVNPLAILLALGIPNATTADSTPLVRENTISVHRINDRDLALSQWDDNDVWGRLGMHPCLQARWVSCARWSYPRGRFVIPSIPDDAEQWIRRHHG